MSNQGCPPGSQVTGIDDFGLVTCAVDQNTQYTAGVGLDLAGTEFFVRESGISTSMLADAVVTSPKIEGGAVTTPKMADASVTTEKLTNAAVTTAKLANLAVSTSKISEQSVTTSKLANASVTNLKMGPAAIKTANIEDGNVTTAKLADNAVTGAKVLKSEVQLRVASCAVGTYITTVNEDGTVVCGTPTGGDFVVSDQACPPGERVTGADVNGVITCTPDVDTTYDGTDFALSNQICPLSQGLRF